MNFAKPYPGTPTIPFKLGQAVRISNEYSTYFNQRGQIADTMVAEGLVVVSLDGRLIAFHTSEVSRI